MLNSSHWRCTFCNLTETLALFPSLWSKSLGILWKEKKSIIFEAWGNRFIILQLFQSLLDRRLYHSIKDRDVGKSYWHSTLWIFLSKKLYFNKKTTLFAMSQQSHFICGILLQTSHREDTQIHHCEENYENTSSDSYWMAYQSN